MITAILHVECAAHADDVGERLEKADIMTVNLTNCKQLVYNLPEGDFLVHIACNDANWLNQAVVKGFSQLEGVTRVMTLLVKNR